jgi:hypothetical protein
MIKPIHIFAVAAMFSLTAVAYAGPADDANAHFKAIGAGSVNQIMEGSADSATLQWVGGPLDGAYTGSDKIREVWGKFAKGNAPLAVSVSKLEESANPKGTTVTANVEFKCGRLTPSSLWVTRHQWEIMIV